jgi:UDP-2-acetamido-3-amino-2,3-dideoxy-glucuronate N-acetyltransferase
MSATPPSDSPQICLAGFGHWGKNLARNFAKLASLAGICEPDSGRSDALQKVYPNLQAFGSYAAVLKDPHIQAVVLATPAEMHFRMALDALRAGKDVFVEKPLALDWCQGGQLVEVARQNGRILMVGHLLRYHPAIIAIEELLAAGTLGNIEYIYSNRLSMGKIRREENALWSFAPHDISVILSLTGQMPLQVTATGGAYLQPNIADVTVSNLLFENGARAHIFVSWLHPYKEQRLVVIGSKQMVVFEDSRSDNKLLLFNRSIELRDGALEAAKPEAQIVPFAADEPLLRECAHFIECIRSRKQPHTPGEEGVRVLQVLQACQRSLQMNGEPVQVGVASEKIMTM